MPKKGNGNDLVPRILQGIRDDMKDLRGDLNLLREDMNRGFARVDQRFDEVNQRLDGVIEIAGGHWRDHEERIKTLEQRVDRLER
jgi:hypothetical protein